MSKSKRTGYRRYAAEQIPVAQVIRRFRDLGQGVRAAGPPGGVYAGELFSEERGETTLFVPVGADLRPAGRAAPVVIPATELAVAVHPGSHTDVDRTYLVGRLYMAEASDWRTEIGWPVFRTRQDGAAM